MATAVAKRRTRQAGPPTGSPTREVILDTAERLFAARGLDGVAVRDIAREMGITASSLYNHFASKQTLYDAVVERGLAPIVSALAAAWQGGFRAQRVHATLDVVTSHLVRHPHLAGLLQRALLEDSATVQALIERWVTSLYREGIAVIRQAAADAGWEGDEVPHLGVALFGLIFAYFTNAAALARVAGWDDPLSPHALAVQRRFLEQAITRLLAPRPRALARKPRRRNVNVRT